MPRPAVCWLALGAATAAVAVALDALGLPSAALFGALVVGLVVALGRPGRVALSGPAFLVAQAVTGVALGAYLRGDALAAVADAWLPVVLVSAATLALSLLAGTAMARTTTVDEPTAALGMLAGGASGVVVMARELGADERIVAFMQYLRVLIIVLATPLLVALAFPGAHAAAPATVPTTEPFVGRPADWAFVAAVAVVGVVAARLLRLPAGGLLGPLLLAAGLTLALPADALTVPPLVRETAFAAIGLHVGLGFTVATVRQLGRLLLPVVASVVALMALCFVLAVALHATSHATLLDAYLATTPGGLFVVLPAALGSGADATFVVAVQCLRVLAMVLVAPFAVRLALRGARGRSSTDGPAHQRGGGVERITPWRCRPPTSPRPIGTRRR